MTTATPRTIRLGATEYPLVLPNIRDPRLHLASAIITIHVLGQTSLGFRVSVPQILVAILTCAVIEVVWAFHKTRLVVWPASAMLTGSGVALILRLVGMERGDHWAWSGWYIFAGVAGLSLITKYTIRYRHTHIFNPSNIGLVVAFLVLGSTVIEPLDFWWAPLGVWMGLAYSVILVGGLLITARLGLLAMALAFWLSLAAGIGVLAASGHCMTTAWALQPVCGSHFWWVIVTSPEVLVFLFFMITDPKTIPAGRRPRIGFAMTLALVCTLLMAPQTTEFGAKVGLLAGLAALTPVRGLFDRITSDGRAPLEARPKGAAFGGPARTFARGAVLGSLLVLAAVGIVAAGAPARESARAAELPVAQQVVDVDPVTLPEVTVSSEAAALSTQVSPEALALALAQGLAIENDAMLRRDSSLLRAADGGERLVEMERRIEIAATSDEYVVSNYDFESLHLDVRLIDGPQGGASLGLEATGSVVRVTYDAAGDEVTRAQEPVRTTFVLTPGNDDKWLIVSEVDDG